MTSTTLSSSLPSTQVPSALLVWVASTTVGSRRSQLAGRLSKSRSVFGRYAETSQPAMAHVVAELRELEGQPDGATLIPTPAVFGTTSASRLLPRGARVVGWLDADGYRGVSDTPQPCPEWLESARAGLDA